MSNVEGNTSFSVLDILCREPVIKAVIIPTNHVVFYVIATNFSYMYFVVRKKLLHVLGRASIQI